MTVDGAVATPATYSLSALESLPQTTFSITRHTWWGSQSQTAQGVSIETLVNAARPMLPSARNAMLRVTVRVGNRFGWHVIVALGELDPGFGNHPAYLALSTDGHALGAPELVIPGDTRGARTVPFADRITVAVQNPTQTASQQHTEIGPTLRAVLRAAHIHAALNTWVAAVGSDGYVAVVTPAQAPIDGRSLLVSLNEDGHPLSQPRLVVDGDVKAAAMSRASSTSR